MESTSHFPLGSVSVSLRELSPNLHLKCKTPLHSKNWHVLGRGVTPALVSSPRTDVAWPAPHPSPFRCKDPRVPGTRHSFLWSPCCSWAAHAMAVNRRPLCVWRGPPPHAGPMVSLGVDHTPKIHFPELRRRLSIFLWLPLLLCSHPWCSESSAS